MSTADDDEMLYPRPPRPSLVRRTASSAVITVFVVTLLWMGFTNDYATLGVTQKATSDVVLDDSMVAEGEFQSGLRCHICG